MAKPGEGRSAMASLGTLAATLLAVYLAVCALLYFFQERLLFLPGIPGRAVPANPAAAGLPFEEVRIATADGETLAAWWVPAPGARYTLVHFHGNAGNIGHRLELLSLLHALPANVLLFDYRGYGQSTGSPDEPGLYRDAEAVWDYLTGTRGLPAERLVLHGQSLGAGVAAHLAAARAPGALILESTFTSVPELAAEIYRWLPVRWLARLRFDTRARLKDVRCPVLVVHSDADELIPYAHGERLYAAAPEPKRLLTIGGDHNAGFWLSREAYAAGLRAFLESLPER
jgi:uncharacterized protein